MSCTSAPDGQIGAEFALKPAPRAPGAQPGGPEGKKGRLAEQAEAMGRAAR